MLFIMFFPVMPQMTFAFFNDELRIFIVLLVYIKNRFTTSVSIFSKGEIHANSKQI